jgi:peptide/nickel transport system substrate-binding protein
MSPAPRRNAASLAPETMPGRQARYGALAGTVLLLAALLAVLVAGCGPTPAGQITADRPGSTAAPPAQATRSGPGADKRGGTLILGLPYEPDVLNAYLRTQAVGDIAGALFERGLVQVRPDGTWTPDLAAEVPSLENGGVSPDGLTITYHLRRNITWSDGDPFNCQDVLFTYQAISQLKAGKEVGYERITALDCLDAYTLTVRFDRYYPAFLSLFATSILPSHTGLDPAQMSTWAYNRHPDPVLGPFVLQEWVLEEQLTAVRNIEYEGWASKGQPYLDAVVVRWIDSSEEGIALLQKGEMDLVWDVAEGDLYQAETWTGIRVASQPSTATERLVLNLRNPALEAPCADALARKPSWHWALGDARVRQAIELAIDKQTLLAATLPRYGSLASSELNQGPFAVDISPSGYDLEAAGELLDQAGWKDRNDDGVRECHGCTYAQEGRPLQLELRTTSGHVLRTRTAAMIAAMLKKVGVEITVTRVPASALFGSFDHGAQRTYGQFDILLYGSGYGIEPHSRLSGSFASSSIPCDKTSGKGHNYSRWIDQEADAALATAGARPDFKARAEAYQKLAERIAAERPQIYLYTYPALDLLSTRLMGYRPHIWDSPSWNAQEWYLKEVEAQP